MTALSRLAFRDVSYRLGRSLPLAPASSAAFVVQPDAARHRGKSRQNAVVLALIAVVIVLDQTAKWWAWRHVPWAVINSGGDILVGPMVGAWYAAPVPGAALDLMDVGLLSVVALVLLRRQANAVTAASGALMIGGWGSNLLDRLGLHYWTAPGSVRGAVDFLHIGGYLYNIADFFIIGGTPLFLLTAGYQCLRAARRSAGAGLAPSPARGRVRAAARMLIPALAALGLIFAAAFGAAHYGGVNATSHTPVQQSGRQFG